MTRDNALNSVGIRSLCLPLHSPSQPTTWPKLYSRVVLPIFQVGRAGFRAPELLFHPHLIGEEGQGIHEAIQKSDMNLRKIFYANIVLFGGSTLNRGVCVCVCVCGGAQR